MMGLPQSSAASRSTPAALREAIMGSHWVLLAGAVLLMLAPFVFLHYVLFHTLVEVVSVVIAISAFAVAWSTHPFSRNHFLTYFGIVLFWSGALDLMHTLLYKGMNVFQGTGTNEPTQVWIATRYLQAAGFLAATWFLDRVLARERVFAAFGVIACALFAAIMLGAFPDAFIEGQGLTPFKIWSEYLVIAVFAGGLGLLWHRRRLLDPTVFIIVAGAIGALIAAEFMFTLYADVYGLSNMVGHLFKLIGYWLIFEALVSFTIKEPFRMMARGASTITLFREAGFHFA